MSALRGTLILLPLLVLVVGCPSGGGGQLPTFSVTGKVTQNGSPVPGASITFSPVDNSKPAAWGRSDAQGMYTLSTYGSGDGAVAGDYKVMVSKSAPGSTGSNEVAHDPTGQNVPSGPPSHNSAGGGAGGAAGGSLLPEKYASAATTPLHKTVEKSENVLDLEL